MSTCFACSFRAASGTAFRHASKRLLIGSARRPLRLLRSQQQEDTVDEILQADVARFKDRQAASTPAPDRQQATPSIWQGVQDAVDKVLIADFFFILLFGFWLLLGVVENGVLHSTTLLDLWYPFWPLVFQPALGVLMLGAICSGLVGWFKSQ